MIPVICLPLAVVSVVATAVTRPRSEPYSVEARGLTDGAYAPYQVTCPSNTTWVRNATNGLAASEQTFINTSMSVVAPSIKTMASSHGLANPPRTPIIGVALAGGGYRAMLTGLGGIEALMNASTESAQSGTGGWLEGVTYWAGLSGGSWATGSFMANGGMLPTDLINNLWNLEDNLVFPEDGKVSYYADLVAEAQAKKSAGFPTQITDIWGLAVGSHVLPSQYQLSNTPNLTFSSLPSVVAALGNGSLPMPIIIAAEREEGEVVIAENATVWEFTPYEFGSWAYGSTTKSPGAFTPLEYLGSSIDAGEANGTCWKGYDQLSFVMGTSATLFNGLLLELNSSDSSSLVTNLIQDFLQNLDQDKVDVSRVPNTFYGYNPTGNPISEFEYITLVDAGETNQNVPLEPLLVPSRNVDAILAFDSSYDTDTVWPNGTALRTTFERAVVLAENTGVNIRMPQVPSEAGFVNGGFNTRPTFFGCNDTTTPLIVYVPSYPWSYAANTSTYQLAYNNSQATSVMLNGLRSLTLNGSVESWPQCLSCALTDRSFSYTSANRSIECQKCFDVWCYDGTSDNTTDPGVYNPVIGSVPPWLLAMNLTKGGDAPASTTTSNTTTGSKSSWGASQVNSAWLGMGAAVGAAVAMGMGIVL